MPNSIPLYPVADLNHAKQIANSINAAADTWLMNAGFKADAFSYLAIPHTDGSIAAVLAGMNPSAPLQALAALPKVLPAGHYQLSTELDAEWQQQAYLGWLLGSYEFSRYQKSNQQLATLEIPANHIGNSEQLAAATALVRDLINTPTDDMGPAHLQTACEQVAASFGAEAYTIIGDDLEEHYPAIHAVGRASHRPPRLIRLSWGDPEHPKIAIVGKGVCFDTGGLNIKTGAGMRKMKKDMGGSAHALALAQLVMAAQLPIRLEVYIPAVENAIAGNAYRPGDVIATRKGLSVEIGNTDAEGRVILADALQLASEHDAELIIDFATLTGAARVALGTDLPAFFCNDADVANDFHLLGDEIEDPIWPMPLYQPYMRLLNSDIADINNNASSAFGGCITAALFLQRFVDPDITWCHFDTYGWNDGNRPGRPAGGEAMGLRASFAYLLQRYGLSD